jgi:cysteinyl-tRNA synthetase
MDRHWSAPTGSQGTGQLHLYNSLVDEKVPFVPAAGPTSKSISWYGCGPTVYDSAHLGHARNYVSFDIVRRILEDYFGYNITCIMNVTDIDDKIIFKARRNHLLKDYAANINSLQQVSARPCSCEGLVHLFLHLLSTHVPLHDRRVLFSLSWRLLQVQQDAYAAVQAAVDKQQQKVAKAQEELAAAESRVKEDFENELKNEQLKLTQAQQAMEGLQHQGLSKDQVLSIAGDYVAQQLDEQRGHEVTEHSIFQAHASKYEVRSQQRQRRRGNVLAVRSLTTPGTACQHALGGCTRGQQLAAGVAAMFRAHARCAGRLRSAAC